MGPAGDTFVKSAPRGCPEYLQWEAAGLRWLAAGDRDEKAADVVPVVSVDEGRLVLPRLVEVAPSASAARAFGAALARTHGAGASGYGAGPPGWVGDGFLGPTSGPLSLPLRRCGSWGSFFAEQRLLVYARLARDRGVFSAGDVAVVEAVARRVASGEFDEDDPPARIHGDLWAGNVLWTPSGAVLIDPAAHGGHRETDLAMLALFGFPFLGEVLAGYEEVSALGSGWRSRVALHQLHPLLVHVVLFAGGYVGQALAAARRYI